MRAPEIIETTRLLLRRPQPADAAAILDRYANDPVVTRYLGWPRHQSIGQTRDFLDFSEERWRSDPAGPYLILARETGMLVGSTGFTFDSPQVAMTGYVLAADSWGKGYATEALAALVALAPALGLVRLYALCHPDHRTSWHVLEKCGFDREGILHQHTVFPNLSEQHPGDVLCYARIWT